MNLEREIGILNKEITGAIKHSTSEAATDKSHRLPKKLFNKIKEKRKVRDQCKEHSTRQMQFKLQS